MGCSAGLNFGGEGIFAKCKGSVPTQHSEELGSNNPGLESQNG